jgi:hypothetical protein
VGHGVELNRQVQISAPCLPLDTGKLLRATRLGSQPARDQQDNNIDSGKASFSSASPAWWTPLCPPRANAGKADPASTPRRIEADSGRHRQEALISDILLT